MAWNSQLLVRPEWIEECRSEGRGPHLIDARAASKYQQGHIPGAVNLPALAVGVVSGGVRTIAPLRALEEAFGKVGISHHITVVLYGERGSVDAAYLFWVLEYLGHPDVRLLDGGIERWVREGRPLTQEVPQLQPRRFTAHPVSKRRVEGEWLLEHFDDPQIQLLDNRSLEEYRGSERYARRGGHIPGARLLPFDETLRADLTFKPLREIERIYLHCGLDPQKTVVNYCQSGTRSAHAYFTQRLIGFRDPRVYEASWAEWANDEHFPVEC